LGKHGEYHAIFENYDIYFSPQVEVSKHVVLGRLSTAAKAEKVKKVIGVFAEYERCRSK